MPIFEYQCREHGIFDEIEKQATKTRACPTCGRQASRVWSVPGKCKVKFRSGFNESAGKYFDTQRDQEAWMREAGAMKLD